MTREDVFEIYLQPQREGDGEDSDGEGEESSGVANMTHREQVFFHLRGSGLSWLQAERAYQDWLKQQQRG